jgi:hypothetical protein
MKIKWTTVVFFSAFLFISIDLIAQGTVNVKDIAVMKYNDNSRGLILGDPISKAITVLGKPTTIDTMFNEIDEKQMTRYKYGKNTILYFMNHRFYSFSLDIGAPFTIGRVKGTAVKTASSVSSLYKNLVTSKSESKKVDSPIPRKADRSQTNLWVSGDVIVDGVVQDCYFQLHYIVGAAAKSAGVFVK